MYNLNDYLRRAVRGYDPDSHMSPGMKKLWIAALRSGRFQQTRTAAARYNTETNDYSFCCLGVLGVCYGESPKSMVGNALPNDAILDKANLNNKNNNALKTLIHYYFDYTSADVFAELNDTQKANFREIADVVERYM